jgi:hypothetical protein
MWKEKFIATQFIFLLKYFIDPLGFFKIYIDKMGGQKFKNGEGKIYRKL